MLSKGYLRHVWACGSAVVVPEGNLAVLGEPLDLMVFKVPSNQNDTMILWPKVVSAERGVYGGGVRVCACTCVCVCICQETELSFSLEKVDPASCSSQSPFGFIFVIYNVIFMCIFSF